VRRRGKERASRRTKVRKVRGKTSRNSKKEVRSSLRTARLKQRRAKPMAKEKVKMVKAKAKERERAKEKEEARANSRARWPPR